MNAQLLSPPEREVLLGVAAGETVTETAARLKRAVGTVKHHRRHVLSKLSARNAAHAVSLGYELGLIGPRHGDWTPASDGQAVAFHAKCNAIDKASGLDRGTTKAEELELLSEKLGRPIERPEDLTFAEAHALLDALALQLLELA